MYDGQEFNNLKGSFNLIFRQVWSIIFSYFNTIFEELYYRTSTAKTVELAGIIKNEVYDSMRKVFNAQKYYVFQNTLIFNSDLASLGFGTIGLSIKILAIFSDVGVKLKFLETTQNSISTFEGITLTGKDDAYFVLVSSTNGQVKKLFSNPQIISLAEIGTCDFLLEKSANIETYEDFLRSQTNGGFGNDNDDSANIIPDYIITLQSLN